MLRRVLFVVVFVSLAILFVSAITERSWQTLAVVVLFTAILVEQKWRPYVTASVPRIEPEDVPAEDVSSAVTASQDRIAAIRTLREMHPGLSLVDAKNLVETRDGHR